MDSYRDEYTINPETGRKIKLGTQTWKRLASKYYTIDRKFTDQPIPDSRAYLSNKVLGVKEVILALSATMEGDTTAFYIFRRLAPTGVKVSVIARGVQVGNEIEYTDELTLGRSITNRTLFSDTFSAP